MMYLQHFELNKVPFSLTPNTEFFMNLTPHHEALEVLKTALDSGEGFIKVTGEVGTGKTLLCRKLMNDLNEQFITVYLPNPYLSPNELRWAVALELGCHYDEQTEQQQLTSMIHNTLISMNQQQKKVVIIVDESQAIPTESLEALRLFTNLETETSKLLQVVLFGQPEINARLQQEDLRQLRQRITFSYHLRLLTEVEVSAYLRHRLTQAGYQGRLLFGSKGVHMIHKASRGTPRLINVLAHKSLLISFGKGLNYISKEHVYQAIQDTEDTCLHHLSFLNTKVLLAASGLLFALALGVLAL
jgi:MSHA biogenesis protein MshM